MKLNRLPVLIRTEVTAAAKSANLPAVYSRALVALEEAVEELSFSKLKQVEVSAEGLAAWAKAHQDEKLTKTARELKFRARRTANYIAEKLAAKRKAEFTARGGRLLNNGNIPATEPEKGGVTGVLEQAGYGVGEIRAIRHAAAVPDEPHFARMNTFNLEKAARGRGHVRSTLSDVYIAMFRNSNSPLRNNSWLRDNSARGLARQLTNPKEIEKSKQVVTLMHAWCEEFLKNLPRNVSKGKT